jgi:maltooligosyltrehalose trehalohydrolase
VVSADPEAGVHVWGPDVATLDVDDLDHPGGARLVAMTRDGAGTWHTPHRPAGRYWLVVDGERLPDPGSTSQPFGFDGPSVMDTGEFAWTDAGWVGRPLSECVLYELHVGTFSPEGTFDGVIARLDHLVDLGIDAIELMPVNTFPGERGWGYDGVLLGAPHAAYGGPEGLRRLVDACHARSIAVVLDVVYNHLGPLGNHIGRFGPFFTERHATPWGSAVNFDGEGSDGVRRFVVDNAVRWIERYHVDGLRLDAVHALHDESAVHIVEEIAAAVHDAGARAGRITWVIAESDLNDPRVVRTEAEGGWDADAAWSDDLHHALHVALTGERQGYYADYPDSLAPLARALGEVYVFAGDHVPSRGRRHGRPVGDLPRSRFIAYSQTHDQVGNRALGERLCHLVPDGLARAAAALVLTGPCVPMLFAGEEWAASSPFQYFTSHPDPELATAVREGRRHEFSGFHDAHAELEVPDPQALTTFLRSKLPWHEVADDRHAWMLEWYRSLIELRRSEPSLLDARAAATEVRVDDPHRWIHVERGDIVVVANLGDEPTVVPSDHPARQVLLASRAGISATVEGWRMPAQSVVVASAR